MNTVQKTITIATLAFLILCFANLLALTTSAYNLYVLSSKLDNDTIHQPLVPSPEADINSKVVPCPTNTKTVWVHLGDHCYHVSTMAMNWGDAQRYCWSQGGYLAEIMSRDEESLLDTFLIGGISYWLGLTNMSNEGIHDIKQALDA